jgi:hypothetical protein
MTLVAASSPAFVAAWMGALSRIDDAISSPAVAYGSTWLVPCFTPSLASSDDANSDPRSTAFATFGCCRTTSFPFSLLFKK